MSGSRTRNGVVILRERNQVSEQSTVALLTPRGRGAVATIRLRGAAALIDAPRTDSPDEPLFLAANGRPLSDQALGRMSFGRWGTSPVEEVVVSRPDEQTVEIHCHGGDAAARRILGDLEQAGCRIVDWTEQALEEQGLLGSECQIALSRATTLRTADVLLDQASGTLRSALETIRASALRSEERQNRGSRNEAAKLSSQEAALAALLAWADFGLHLTAPWRVVLSGRPNVGKSSLINALLGYARSIVFDQPGTTRDVVTAATAFDGWPVLLADTAGIRTATSAIEAAGVVRAREHFQRADCRVVVLDVSREPEPDDLSLLSDWPDAMVVAHKADLPDCWGTALPAAAVRVSSLTGDGVESLADAIVRRLVPEVPSPGTAVPVSTRQVDLLHRAFASAHGGDMPTLQEVLNELLS